MNKNEYLANWTDIGRKWIRNVLSANLGFILLFCVLLLTALRFTKICIKILRPEWCSCQDTGPGILPTQA